jgi:hypothetical protein
MEARRNYTYKGSCINLKKIFGLAFVAIILAFGVFQPYSLNLEKVFAQDNTSNNINNNTNGKKNDCVPCKNQKTFLLQMKQINLLTNKFWTK